MLTVDFERLQFTPGDRILDLGCGEGRHSLGAMYTLENITIVGVDLNPLDLATAQKRKLDIPAKSPCYFICADGLDLPFGDHSFDHIICSEVLEHIPNYRGMLNEIERLLKPNGQLVVSVPRFWPEKICWWLDQRYHQVEGGHIRIFKSRILRNVVEEHGFSFESRHWAHALHVPYWWLRCAFWRKGDAFFLTRWYHKMLVWDLFKKPWITQALEKILNPALGKSVVLYFRKSSNNL